MRERIEPLAAERGIRYMTGDLDPTGVDLELDLQALALPDAGLPPSSRIASVTAAACARSCARSVSMIGASPKLFPSS